MIDGINLWPIMALSPLLLYTIPVFSGIIHFLTMYMFQENTTPNLFDSVYRPLCLLRFYKEHERKKIYIPILMDETKIDERYRLWYRDYNETCIAHLVVMPVVYTIISVVAVVFTIPTIAVLTLFISMTVIRRININKRKEQDNIKTEKRNFT